MFRCISLDRDLVLRVGDYVIFGETAEILAIVFGELRVTLISDPETGLTDRDGVQ